MRLRYVALIIALVIVLNAAVSYGIARWAAPSGAQGPRGVQGIPWPVATMDVNTTLCAAAIGAPYTVNSNNAVKKYCP